MKILKALMIFSSGMKHFPGVLQDGYSAIVIYLQHARIKYNGSFLMDMGTNTMHLPAAGA